METPRIARLPISALRPHPRNSRQHTEEQVAQIARSIEAFGFTIPVLIDEKNTILAGHARTEAARRIGMLDVPCVAIEYLTEAQKRAYIVADNRLAQNAGWDVEILAEELEFLSSEGVALEIDDPTITGFDAAEIDVIVDGGDLKEAGLERALGKDSRRGRTDPADDLPEVHFDRPAVTQVGDLWILGPHRLHCSDALVEASYRHLLEYAEDRSSERLASDIELADLVFTDPPYNVPIDGHVGGLGKIRHREFAYASGEMSEAAFTRFLTTIFENLARRSRDGTVAYICMDWRHQLEVLNAGRGASFDLLNLCVWAKPSGAMGSLYRSRHELVFVFRNGKAPHTNNVQLGSRGRYRTNVWEYPGIVGSGRRGQELLKLHPTVKPVALVADAIRDTSKRGDIVLDPFGGSGTTLIACEKTGRRARLLEIDPHYCDVIVERWEKLTGASAIHQQSGASFAGIAAKHRIGEEAGA